MKLDSLRVLLGFKPRDPFTLVPFPRLAKCWQRRMKAWPPTQPPAQDGAAIAILVTPWLGSAVPFFNMEVALMLAAASQRVTILWDGNDLMGNAPSPVETAAIAEALKTLPPWIEVIEVGTREVPSQGPRPLDDAWLEDMLFQIGIWRMRGETTAKAFVDRKRPLIPQMRDHAARLHGLLIERKWDWLLIPGGVWGLSALYVRLAEQTGCAYTAYDGGVRMMVFAHDSVACHQMDMAVAVEMVEKHFTAEARDYLVRRAWKEFEERRAGRGNYNKFQVCAEGQSATDCNVLVPLNQRWDTAALSRQRLFATVEEWVLGLLQWAESEPKARIFIREHPGDRLANMRSSDDIASLIRRNNKVGDRVRFIAAGEAVSTYDLLKTTKVVSPYTSSVGIEAGMLRLPVVVSAHNYYERASFVFRPETQGEYFKLLSRALRDELVPPDRGASDAALLYHLVQECNLMPTVFTGGPVDFLDWVEIPPRKLWRDPTCVDLREALLTRQPLSYLVSRRMVAAKFH